MINLAIIEDNHDIRQNVQQHFAGDNPVQCVLATDTVEKFMRHYRPELEIRVLLLDIHLPGISGLDAIGQLKKLLPDGADIIMFTVFNEPDAIFKAICSGATGYVLKNEPLKKVEEQLLEVVEEGGSAVSSSVARRIIQYFSPKPAARAEAEAAALKPIERQIVHYLVEGLTYPEIAQLMSLSVPGVKYHQGNIFKKLNVSSRNEVTNLFLKRQVGL